MPQRSIEAQQAGTLNLRQERFVSAYLLDPNATKAAMAAGYSAGNAERQAWLLMKNPDVKAAIAERSSKALRVADTSVARITRELAAIGFSDVGALFIDGDDGPRLRPLSEWPPEIRVCIASIKTTRRVLNSGVRKVKDPDEGEDVLVNETEAELVTEIKLWSKIEALKLLAVYRKMVGGDSFDGDGPRQTFVGLAVTVAPGAVANFQLNGPAAGAGGRSGGGGASEGGEG